MSEQQYSSLDYTSVSILTLSLILTVRFMKVSSPVTGLEWPRGLQEVKVPRYNGTEW